MSVTLTDPNGRSYTFCEAELQLLGRLLGKNVGLRKELLRAMVEADNKRLEMAIAITSAKYEGPLLNWPTRPAPYNDFSHCHWTAGECLRDVENKYQETIDELVRILGDRADFSLAQEANFCGFSLAHP